MALLDPNEKLAWLKTLKEEDIIKVLSSDSLLIYQECGVEVLVKLWEKFGGMPFYISNEPLTKLKKIYVKQAYNGTNAKRLAMELNVCERFIYNARLDSNGNAPEEPTLFDKL